MTRAEFSGWYKRNVAKLRAVLGFVAIQVLSTSSPEQLMEWSPKRWIFGGLVGLALGMKAGEWNSDKKER